MFISSLGAITAVDNRLDFKPAERVCTILVDGLGSANLKGAKGHAPFLNSALATQGSISCGFPSTTAASITSFATGLQAEKHGFVGYRILDRETDADVNLLTGWNRDLRGELWQPQKTVSELAIELGVDCFVIGPAEYEASGFTMATMRSAKYVAARSISDRFESAAKLLKSNSKTLIYLYVPELDQAAHALGTSSDRWLQALEALDSAVKQLCGSLTKGVGVVLTADHGIVNVAHHKHRFLDESPLVDFDVRLVGGDPRVPYIYLEPSEYSQIQTIKRLLQEWIGDEAWVLDKQQLIENFFAEATESAQTRLPDIAVLARAEIALYHRGFAKPKSMQMIGQHGSISPKELAVPLLKFGALA